MNEALRIEDLSAQKTRADILLSSYQRRVWALTEALNSIRREASQRDLSDRDFRATAEAIADRALAEDGV